MWARFTHTGGLSEEVMIRNMDNIQPLILGVDESKFTCQPTSGQNPKLYLKTVLLW
ncbi:MAG: hypothetical protein WAN47_01100 [Nitrosotalea sp.]